MTRQNTEGSKYEVKDTGKTTPQGRRVFTARDETKNITYTVTFGESAADSAAYGPGSGTEYGRPLGAEEMALMDELAAAVANHLVENEATLSRPRHRPEQPPAVAA